MHCDVEDGAVRFATRREGAYHGEHMGNSEKKTRYTHIEGTDTRVATKMPKNENTLEPKSPPHRSCTQKSRVQTRGTGGMQH